jgi:hypothetical protein
MGAVTIGSTRGLDGLTRRGAARCLNAVVQVVDVETAATAPGCDLIYESACERRQARCLLSCRGVLHARRPRNGAPLMMVMRGRMMVSSCVVMELMRRMFRSLCLGCLLYDWIAPRMRCLGQE